MTWKHIALILIVSAQVFCQDLEECRNIASDKWCERKKALCKTRIGVKKRCLETCGFCDKCEDVYPSRRCKKLQRAEKCDWDEVKFFCIKTCGYCDDEITTLEPPTAAPPSTAAPSTAAPSTAAPTTAAPTTAVPSTAAPSTAAPTSASPPAPSGNGYRPVWDEVVVGDQTGEANMAHVHEGLRLKDGSGWVGVGHTFGERTTDPKQVIVKRVDNQGKTQWTKIIGDSSSQAYSVGFSICEAGGRLYVGAGLWDSGSQKAAVIALNTRSGDEVWKRTMGSGQGGVRGIIADVRGGSLRLAATGYTDHKEKGFVFIAEEGKAMTWLMDESGTVLQSRQLQLPSGSIGQGAKIRQDPSGGYVVATTGWGDSVNDQVVVVAKLGSTLELEWIQGYGVNGGSSQCFDMLVDTDGNYLMGGHTTVGQGVQNWDYLALKVDSATRNVLWRKTFGQPRGFDPKWIHDEMYGVALDPNGNYLLLGGSGDESSYSASNATSPVKRSDEWVSYLVVVDKLGNQLYEGIYGLDGSNNAGEYLSVDQATGDVMVYVDSDAVGGGFGFLKLEPVKV